MLPQPKRARTNLFQVKQLPTLLYALILLILVIAPGGELVKKAYSGELALPHSGSSTFVPDFVFFYVAGKMAISEDRFQCYEPELQKPWFQQVMGAEAAVPASIFNVHITPLAFPLLVPFAMLPINSGEISWLLFSLAVAGVGGFLLSKSTSQFNGNVCWIWLLWTLASFSSWQSLLTGQFSFLELGLVELFIWSWLTRRENLAGAFLALATLKPHYAIFLLAPALSSKRVVISFALCELFLLVVTASFVGIENVINYPKIVTHMDATMQANTATMVCLRGLLSHLPLNQHTILSINLVCLAIAFLAIVYLSKKMKTESLQSQSWIFVLAILTALLFSPHTFFYDYVLMAPAALFIPSWNILEIPLKKSPSLWLWSVILLCYPLLSWVLVLCSNISILMPLASTTTLAILIACGLKQIHQIKQENPTVLLAD
ncbi:hypothetical protein BH11CYA1_BH11CYA1_35380 [soil metagenome]